MSINSAIRAMFGITATMSAMVASLPASADSVTPNNSTSTASQTVSGTTPSFTVSGVTINCSMNFTIVAGSGITVGTAYIPPVLLLGIASAAFTSGSPFCGSVAFYVGSAPAASVSGNTVLSPSHPWPIEITSANATTQTAMVTIQDFIIYTPAFGYCYGNVTGIYSSHTASTNPDTLALSAQTLTHANASGVVIGTCTINAGVLLPIVPQNAITIVPHP